jgi:ATP-dependent Clp protease ATP-binding subunit ClpA
VREEIEAKTVPSEDNNINEPRLTPRAKRVLELCADEARRLKHNYIGSEHMLLGLLREKDGISANVLGQLGLNVETARQQVRESLGIDAEQPQNASPQESEPTPTSTSEPTLKPHADLPLVEGLIATLDEALSAIAENDADRLYVAQQTLTALRDDLRRSARQSDETSSG